MSKVFFVGTNNGRSFNVQAEKGRVQELLALVLREEDEKMEDAVAVMGLPGKCIDAMAWEADDSIQNMITALDIDGRFAIQHNSIVFGVAANEVEAMAAFRGKEF